MKARLFSREVLPFCLALLALAAAALLCDAALHLLDAVWIGRWLGIPGTLMILGSLGLFAAQAQADPLGPARQAAALHETMAWAGSLLVLVHAGIHFNAILGWLAVWAMLINVASGLTGKFLLGPLAAPAGRGAADDAPAGPVGRAAGRAHLLGQPDLRRGQAVARRCTFPITLAFAVLALAHIVAVFLFWGWK